MMLKCYDALKHGMFETTLRCVFTVKTDTKMTQNYPLSTCQTCQLVVRCHTLPHVIGHIPATRAYYRFIDPSIHKKARFKLVNRNQILNTKNPSSSSLHAGLYIGRETHLLPLLNAPQLIFCSVDDNIILAACGHVVVGVWLPTC